MARFQPPRGTKDFLTEEMIRRHNILDKTRSVFELFGFGPMDTPAFESWELLSKKGGGGDEIKDEIYYFKDKSDRELGLRFDLTVPLGRVVTNNPNLQLPFKRYQLGKVWRYDRPQAGRMREFLQFDADIVGSIKMNADIECIAVAVEVLNKLGFRKITVRLNNRKILSGLSEFLEIPEGDTPKLFRVLDKFEKIPRNEVNIELEKIGLSTAQIRKLMDLVEVKGRGSKIINKIAGMFEGIKDAMEGLDEIEEISRLSKSYGIDKYLEIDLGLVRGLDYYTGPIFELVIDSGKKVGSVAGGGRYDNLIETFGGKQTPATGISLGIERIFEILKTEKSQDSKKSNTSVFVVCVNDKVRNDCIEISQKLRNSSINAETDMMGRDLRKQLEYVNKKGISYALIVGPKELSSRKFVLKNMKNGNESILGIERIIKNILA